MDDVVAWLLSGDVAVEYQTRRDLLDDDRPELRDRIGAQGYAAALLAARRPDGHWGLGYYQPKWISTHYTLLELCNLGLAPDHPVAREAVELVLAEHQAADGGIDLNGRGGSDACVNGMALHFCAYFGGEVRALTRLVDWLLERRLPDGGFNCHRNRPTHSSHHTTVSVLEGLTSYLTLEPDHHRDEVSAAVRGCAEYLLRHRLFRSHTTGEVIHSEFLRLHHPPRWHFDVLRGLDALAAAGVPADPRMDDALDSLEQRRRPDGRWAAARAWPGQTHAPGTPQQWVTLGALRVLRTFGRAE